MWRRLIAVLVLMCVFTGLSGTAWSEASVPNYPPGVIGRPFTLPQHLGVGNPNSLLANVNALRKNNHLPPLRANAELSRIAEQRGADMLTRQYYAHKNPDGLYYYNLLQNQGLEPDYSCENLDLVSAEAQVMGDWLNSTKGHRECMLNKDTIEAGYAIIPFTTEIINDQWTNMYLVVAIQATLL